jgi:hypothetical protein
MRNRNVKMCTGIEVWRFELGVLRGDKGLKVRK